MVSVNHVSSKSLRSPYHAAAKKPSAADEGASAPREWPLLLRQGGDGDARDGGGCCGDGLPGAYTTDDAGVQADSSMSTMPTVAVDQNNIHGKRGHRATQEGPALRCDPRRLGSTRGHPPALPGACANSPNALQNTGLRCDPCPCVPQASRDRGALADGLKALAGAQLLKDTFAALLNVPAADASAAYAMVALSNAPAADASAAGDKDVVEITEYILF